MVDLQQVELALLDPHPQNPRITLREDVVAGIAAGINGEYPKQHALIVRPKGKRFEVLSGHHRKAAAEESGLSRVWCWVEELSDEEAYMRLVTSNSQGELSPLEIGRHALPLITKSGRGAKGGGAKAYAGLIGKSFQFVSLAAKGAKVANKCSTQVEHLHDKTKHLAAIADLPQECWPDAVTFLLEKKISADKTQEAVKEAKEFSTPRRCLAVFNGKTTAAELARIDKLAIEVENKIHSEAPEDDKRVAELIESLGDEWAEWVRTEDPTDIKVVQAKRVEFEDRLSELVELSLPDKPNLVLADPPWRYDFAETDNRQIENHYPSATPKEIVSHCPDTADDCILLMWATAPKLREAFEVLDGWGFEYKTHAIWDKQKIGMGYWFRGQHELLIVATKGNVSPPDSSMRVSSLFSEARKEHSVKPECVYEWIEDAFSTSVKLEMYCRSPRKGWMVHGNESA